MPAQSRISCSLVTGITEYLCTRTGSSMWSTMWRIRCLGSAPPPAVFPTTKLRITQPGTKRSTGRRTVSGLTTPSVSQYGFMR